MPRTRQPLQAQWRIFAIYHYHYYSSYYHPKPFMLKSKGFWLTYVTGFEQIFRNMDTCMFCGAVAPCKRCGSCRVAAYCSSNCQSVHWPTHKEDCRAASEKRLFSLEGKLVEMESCMGKELLICNPGYLKGDSCLRSRHVSRGFKTYSNLYTYLYLYRNLRSNPRPFEVPSELNSQLVGVPSK